MYKQLLANMKQTIADMDQSESAEAATGATTSGLAQGIESHVPEITAAIDKVIEQFSRLSGLGLSLNLGPLGTFSFKIDGSHANGLDYVPFDGYLSELHEGEGILTAEENRIWQRFKNGQGSTRNVDYEQLGGLMRDNVRPGGDVFLNGRVVGEVISQIQGNQYRTLQRSGWQS